MAQGDIIDVMFGWFIDIIGWIINLFVKLTWGVIKFIWNLIRGLFSSKGADEQTHSNE